MYVSNMVTQIHKGARLRLYLREHRKARGLAAQQVADRLEIERESLLRFEREAQTRASPEKLAAYAVALNIEPEALFRPPETPSLDAMVKSAPDDVQKMAADIVQRLIARR